jgi:hypothetical protein
MSSNKFNVIDSYWFNKIGIVKVKTQFSGIKYYIHQIPGIDKHFDEQFIAKLGSPLTAEILPFLKDLKSNHKNK